MEGMKKDKNTEIEEIKQYLIEQLSIEKNTNIPSIPENLKPENIEKFIQKQKPKNSSRKLKKYMVTFSSMAATVLCVIFFSTRKIGLNNEKQNGAENKTFSIEVMEITNDMEFANEMGEEQESTPWRFPKERTIKPKIIFLEKRNQIGWRTR